jgi:hypothetical protein
MLAYLAIKRRVPLARKGNRCCEAASIAIEMVYRRDVLRFGKRQSYSAGNIDV